MVKHILKDGTVLSDITGYVVKAKDAESAYAIISKMNERTVIAENDNNARLERP